MTPRLDMSIFLLFSDVFGVLPTRNGEAPKCSQWFEFEKMFVWMAQGGCYIYRRRYNIIYCTGTAICPTGVIIYTIRPWGM